MSTNYPKPFNGTSNKMPDRSLHNWSMLKSSEPPKDMNIVKYELMQHQFVKGVLQYEGKSIGIFIYSKSDLISKQILNYGMWESVWIDQFVKYIRNNIGIQVIDVGCNLGVYTLMAASMGSKVIAIDANKNNTDRLSQSIIGANYVDYVTLLLNAVSNERKSFSMRRVPSNIGGQWVLENRNNTYQVKSIFLDDLLPFVRDNQDVMMKMDIETHEIKALSAAANLFDLRNIKLIFMEWAGVKFQRDSYIVMHFFLSRKYKPFLNFYSTNRLDVLHYEDWPHEVVWRRS